MYCAYGALMKIQAQVYSVKTDAFTIRKSDLEKAKALSLIKFGADFGDWRIEKEFCLPYKNSTTMVNKKVDIVEPVCDTLSVEDEWDTDTIVKQNVLPYGRLMIRGFVPGTGKSYICKRMQNLGYKVLFVVPTNELGQECGCE